MEGRSEPSDIANEEGWKRLWKVKVPSKLRIFALRFARSSLPTGEARAHRMMATNGGHMEAPPIGLQHGGVYGLLEKRCYSADLNGDEIADLRCRSSP